MIEMSLSTAGICECNILDPTIFNEGIYSNYIYLGNFDCYSLHNYASQKKYPDI